MRYLLGLMLAVVLTACGDDVNLRLATSLHYDDFPGATVNLAKWSVDTTGDGATGTATATVTGGIATLDLTAVSGDIQSSLYFPPAVASVIGRLGARVTLQSYLQGGGSNVRFRLFMRPYKDDKYASGGPPDLTSDIFAQLRIRAGQFQALVSRCLDAGCSSEVIFGTTVLGAVTLGQTYDMALEYDGTTKFYFFVGGVGSAYFDATEGGVYANIGPSGVDRANLEVIASSGAPTTGNARADVDYVICSHRAGDLC